MEQMVKMLEMKRRRDIKANQPISHPTMYINNSVNPGLDYFHSRSRAENNTHVDTSSTFIVDFSRKSLMVFVLVLIISLVYKKVRRRIWDLRWLWAG